MNKIKKMNRYFIYSEFHQERADLPFRNWIYCLGRSKNIGILKKVWFDKEILFVFFNERCLYQ